MEISYGIDQENSKMIVYKQKEQNMCLIVSAYDGQNFLESIDLKINFSAGANNYVPKPLKVVLYLKKIEQFLVSKSE
jgi:hypothetical protein